MIVDFYLKHENMDSTPTEIFSDNLLELEKLCKQALLDGDIVALHSKSCVSKPESVYELSIMIAEDIVMKFNPKNLIIR